MTASLPDAAFLIDTLAAALAPGFDPDTRIVGIHTGGVWVAERLRVLLRSPHPIGQLDISFYRDDFSRIGLHPQVKPSNLPWSLEGQPLLLVDDVLHTGRTVRAAMNELFDYGRPASIALAVLIDRGGHELPIRPDFAGLVLDLPPHQNIHLSRLDDGHLTLSIA